VNAMGTKRPARGVAAPPTAMDGWVPWLLLFGGFAWGIGWLVGLVGLWASRAWRVRDKLIGTLLWPGGLALAVVALGLPEAVTSCSGSGAVASHCTTTGYVMPLWLGVPAALVALCVPVAVAVHLLRELGRKRQTLGS